MEHMVLLLHISLSMLAGECSPQPAQVPPMGWSTWTTFKCSINETLIYESIDAAIQSGIATSGYNFILIDDCWATSRNQTTGTIEADITKFPNGFRPIVDYAHSKKLRMGIYTSVGHTTCAGYVGSLHHEALDAQTFHSWGFDFIKHDTCVDGECTVRNGCLQNATRRMRDAILSLNADIVYYLDAGNPTNEMKLFNPRGHHVAKMDSCLATQADELAWRWATSLDGPDETVPGKGPHIIKAIFDIKDTFAGTLMNLHSLVRVAEYQTCGQYITPDMLTTGMGGQTIGQYRAQFYLWAVLGAPLILSNDIRSVDANFRELVTNSEVIAVDQDPECVMGSLVRAHGSSETWIRPLADDSFAVVLLNKAEVPTNITVMIAKSAGEWGDFFPAVFDDSQMMTIRDLGRHVDLGNFQGTFTATVGPMDAAMLKMTPESSYHVKELAV